MLKQLFILVFLGISISGISQINPLDLGKSSTKQTTVEETKIIRQKTNAEKEEIPFAIIEKVPVYPGCENAGGNSGKKKCMSNKITEHINKKFNTNIVGKLSKGKKRIMVTFKINKSGNVVNVKAKSEESILKKEAVRVVNTLPKMTPGQQKGKNVGVLYTLPILFQVQ